MHALSSAFQKCRDAVNSAADYIRTNGKTYLVAIVGLTAIYSAYYISSHLQDEYTVRHSGGRSLASSLASPTYEEMDPTPVLRRLATMIHNS